MKRLAILGSTGSVGSQTVDVLVRNPNQYNVELLAARSNWRLMEEQVRLLRPNWVVMADEKAASQLRPLVADLSVQVFSDNLLELLEREKFDLVVASMVGHEGLLPVTTAIQAGSDIALANKEALVMAGEVVVELCKKHNVKLLPLDSEHSAIFQCLQGNSHGDILKLVLTASGGPFRDWSHDQLKSVSPSDAVKHPNWSMGAKISVDSATLMNKGLEVIEARWLFDVKPEQIEIVVHPQSIIHSMVEFTDGSVLGHMGVPSMELPIQYALSWPKRWSGEKHQYLDWMNLPTLTFEPPNMDTFPCLKLARQALVKGGNAPAILSTANDLCVEAFLQGRLGFTQIPEVIAHVLELVPWLANPSLDNIVHTMETSICQTDELIKSLR